MELTVTTPGLLFPAISLMMLAHTNRFLALAALIRTLRDRYRQEPGQPILRQIGNLRHRLHLIRTMQVFGLLSFLFCAVCILCIVEEWHAVAFLVFATSITCFMISLIISLVEIILSMKALEVELSDVEQLK